jgi:hypothetical protein
MRLLSLVRGLEPATLPLPLPLPLPPLFRAAPNLLLVSDRRNLLAAALDAENEPNRDAFLLPTTTGLSTLRGRCCVLPPAPAEAAEAGEAEARLESSAEVDADALSPPLPAEPAPPLPLPCRTDRRCRLCAANATLTLTRWRRPALAGSDLEMLRRWAVALSAVRGGGVDSRSAGEMAEGKSTAAAVEDGVGVSGPAPRDGLRDCQNTEGESNESMAPTHPKPTKHHTRFPSLPCAWL